MTDLQTRSNTSNHHNMTKDEHTDEIRETLQGVLSRWAPFPEESDYHKMMRALLCLAAYERDCSRIANGKRPIRQNYPIPLPKAVPKIQSVLEHGVGEQGMTFRMAANAIWNKLNFALHLVGASGQLENTLREARALADSIVHHPQSGDLTGAMDSFQKEAFEWSSATFPHQTQHSQISHLRKEVEELALTPEDGSELADCLILLLNLASMAGLDLLTEARRKLEINRRRTWGAPDADGVCHHTGQADTEAPKQQLAEDPQHVLRWYRGQTVAECPHCRGTLSKATPILAGDEAEALLGRRPAEVVARTATDPRPKCPHCYGRFELVISSQPAPQ